MKKRNVMILVLLLVVGFASVSTSLILNGTIGIGTNEDDFDVIFTSATLDGEETSNVVISENKKKITFSSNKLTNVKDKSRLDYKVKNNSTQYGANVTISCNTTGNEYVSITGEFANETLPIEKPILMDAQEVKSGYISAEMIKSYAGEDTSISITCEINGSASSRETSSYTINFDSQGGSEVEEIVVTKNDTYGELPVPEKEDYVFLGWYTEDGEKITSDAMVNLDKNTVVQAKWAILCPYEIGKTWDFNYKNAEEEFQVPCDAEFKIEVWGAQGGNAYSSYIGGYGGYSVGNVNLAYEESIFINVGGAGKTGVKEGSTNIVGGYNGGGMSYANRNVSHYYGSGGGATHIAKRSGILSTLSSNKSDILIVAGGGGGGRYQVDVGGIRGSGGSGGGYIGVGGTVTGGWTATSKGGTQTSAGGDNATFGKGADAYGDYVAQGAGGGGYYGGAHGHAGAGGSGYIGNSLLTNKSMYCYNCEESNEEQTKTISTTNVSSTPTSEYAKTGNGYARITLVSLPY